MLVPINTKKDNPRPEGTRMPSLGNKPLHGQKASTSNVAQYVPKGEMDRESNPLENPGEENLQFDIRPTMEKKPFPSSIPTTNNNQGPPRPIESRNTAISRPSSQRRPQSEEIDDDDDFQSSSSNNNNNNNPNQQRSNNSSVYNDFFAMHQDMMIQQLLMQAMRPGRQIDPDMGNIPLDLILGNGNNRQRSQLEESNKPAPKIDVYDPASLKKSTDPTASTKGLSKHQIDSIIPINFQRNLVKSDDPSKLECNICLVPFEDGDKIKMLQCLHTFHSKCIGEWLHKKSICPECNFNLRTLDFNQLY